MLTFFLCAPIFFRFFIPFNSLKSPIQSNLPVEKSWEIGPFIRPQGQNPILKPIAKSNISNALKSKGISEEWQNANVFNPAAAIQNGKVELLYRAESNPQLGVGQHVSRIGLATSSDGLHFIQNQEPVIYPEDNKNKEYEIPGGCEDPRAVYQPHIGYVITYTAYDRKTARLCIATSKDLKTWRKYGPAFSGTPYVNTWSKSGSIICHLVGSNLEPLKINHYYWMYWGEAPIRIATSQDLIHWHPLVDKSGNLISLVQDRPDHFDSALVEPGPPAILTKLGIVFIYNGKNADQNGDPSLRPGEYSAGQLLISAKDPTKVLDRLDKPFLFPQESFEVTGQYKAGTVFAEGLAYFHQKWFLYFGEADSYVGVAIAKK